MVKIFIFLNKQTIKFEKPLQHLVPNIEFKQTN